MIVDFCGLLIVLVENKIIELKNKINITEQENHFRKDLMDLRLKLREAKKEYESNRFYPYNCEICNMGTFIRPLCPKCHSIKRKKEREIFERFNKFREKEGEI